MKQTKILMGMPVALEIVDPSATEELFDAVFGYFQHVDDKFSTYKPESEISQINNHLLGLESASDEMKTIFQLAEETRLATDGFFDIEHKGFFDPSGLVKGWAIQNAAELLCKKGLKNFYVEAGGDIQAFGKNSQEQNWRVGISNPFNINEIVKVISVSDCGVATSGTYIRGQHIYNPKDQDLPLGDIMSLTVIGPDIFEADRFATAAFAMGREGIYFIESLQGFEGYMIDQYGRATFTTGFQRFVING